MATEFLGDVAGWSALRSLSFEVLPEHGNDEPASPTLVVPPTVYFPSLEEVQMKGNCVWPCEHAETRYPSVRTFSFQPCHDLCADLRAVVSTCENLETLSLDLQLVQKYSGPPDDSLFDLALSASQVRTVRIRGISRTNEKCILDIFRLSSRVELSLEYCQISDVGSGRAIFRDLGEGARVSVTCEAEELSLRGTDRRGCLRRISAPVLSTASSDDLQRLVCSKHPLPWPKVAELTVDYSLWFSLARHLPALPALTALELVVDDTEVPLRSDEPPSLPALRSLTLLSRAGVVILLPGQVANLVRGLGIPCQLANLRVDHRLVTGNLAFLSGLAPHVKVGVCHV
ncbi:hypothetical protein AURDEDRAFT_160907 [Auricularia subglabra TFB-10046 SS5]|nr:hypothetical protein AURDEDRAFT_160907 [Auricularia subglabra TFB-10046 SS5]